MFRPIRSYFYWEQHCYDIPDLLRVAVDLFDSLDGFDQLAEQFHELSGDIAAHRRRHARVDGAVSPMITTMKTTRGMTLTMYSTFKAMIDQMEAMSDTAIVMGQSFDTAKNDDFFYLPPEAFENPDFQTRLQACSCHRTVSRRASSSPTRAIRRRRKAFRGSTRSGRPRRRP